ncbi:EamA family transporter [Agromyces sp. PvR057]|uniref:EamA family transporter n=1 Tax=Agromyces sp. PvR057 TaxID=3156403 RepID=UPI003397BA57
MTALVIAPVLLAAALHSAWNAIAKAAPDRTTVSALIGTVYCVTGAIGAIALPLPTPAAVPFIAASVLVQTAYMLLLSAAYARGEFSQAYPLARGTSVVIVIAVSVGLLGETLTPVQSLGVAVVAIALFALAAPARGTRIDLGAVGFAALTGCAIAAYSLIDGIGVRAAGDAFPYMAWLFLLHGALLVATCLLLLRRQSPRGMLSLDLRRNLVPGLVGGLLSLIAYGTVVWAQSLAPLAVVSALRESSVLFAAIIGATLFRERMTLVRATMTVAAALGIAVIRFG